MTLSTSIQLNAHFDTTETCPTFNLASMDKPRVVVETTESTNVGYLGFALDILGAVEGHALGSAVGILFGYGRDGE